MTEAVSARRLFFALWPDDETRDRLACAGRAVELFCGGRAIPAGNLHLTLAFLGNVPNESLNCLSDCSAAYRGEGFRLVIDCVESFHQAGTVWLGPTEAPPGLNRLYEHIRRGITACGQVPEARPFRPHVTVIRKTLRAPVTKTVDAIPWMVNDFVLAESVLSPEGAFYQVLRRWPLQAKHSDADAQD